MKHSSLPILVLAASCNILLASGLEKSSVEYRRNRKSHVVHDQEQALLLPRKDDEANQLRHATSRRTNSNQSNEDQQLERQTENSSNRRRARGSNTKRQSRRELSKSSGKSGSKSSGKSGSSSSSGGSSSGGGSSGSGGSSGGGSDSTQKASGYNSDDGTYCGCLCDNAYSDYGFDTHGISCDYHVEEYSYGEGVSDPNPDNSDALMAEYFSYNRYTKWAVIEESSTDDFFTNGGNWNNDEEEEAEGRADDGYQNDEDDAAQAEAVVIEELVDDYDPYAAFDIGKCDTYSHLWTYDLFSSCSDGDQYCECTYAEELIGRGLLSCSDLSLCPSECGVCSTCLHSICDEYLPSQLIVSGFKSNQGYALAAVITTVVLAAWVNNKRKRPKGGILGESLMDDDGIPYAKRDWKVRIGKDGLPTEKKSWRAKKLQVWLAPDVSTIPKRQPLFPDLLPNPDEKNKKQKVMEMSDVAGSKKRSKRRHMAAPVIVTSDKVSVASSLSYGGVDENGLSTRLDSESLHGFEGDI